MDGEEIEEDVEEMEGAKQSIAVRKRNTEVEFGAPGVDIREEIDEEPPALEVDDEDTLPRIRDDDEESDYCETDLELNEDTTDDERDTDERQAYKDICDRLDTIPITRVMDEILTPAGRNITVLDLAHHGIGDRGARAIAKALSSNETLLTLDVSDNGIEGVGGAALARMIGKLPSLTDVNLSENQIGNQPEGDASVALGEMIDQGNLKTMNLSRNGFVDGDMEPIANALKSSTALKVDISHNLLGEVAGLLLGPAIEENSSITDLDLSWNQIRLKGADAIADGLGKNSTLLVVNLGWNGFGDVGAESCSKMLGENKTLEVLTLSNNRIRVTGSSCLAKALCSGGNSTLKSLALQHNELSDEGIIIWLATLRENNTLKTLDLNYVEHSANVNELVHALIDRSHELDVEVVMLKQEEKKLQTRTAAWEAIQAAQAAVEVCQKQKEAAILKEEWEQVGKIIAEHHYCEANFSRLLGAELFQKWQKVVQIPIAAKAHMIKAGQFNLNSRLACAHAVATNPGDRELPVTAAYDGFVNSPGAEDEGVSENEIFFLASYAALSGVVAGTSALTAMWLNDTSLLGSRMRDSFEAFITGAAPTPKIVHSEHQDGGNGSSKVDMHKPGFSCEISVPGVMKAKAAFISAYGPAYFAADHVYTTMRAKHPKDQQVALKAAKETYMNNGGNAAFDPTHEIGENEAIRQAVTTYKKEMRLGKIADGDQESAASSAYREYKSVFGRHTAQHVTTVINLFFEEKLYEAEVARHVSGIETQYTTQVQATKLAASKEAAARKKEHEAERRPDFDLRCDFGLREGEILTSRRDPFDLLHEFLDRHELRYFDLFVSLEKSGNGFLSMSELLVGLDEIGFVVSEDQKIVICEVFFPLADRPSEEEADKVQQDEFGADVVKVEQSITYHMFTNRLFTHMG
jgi:Ran GTPase-activating protein (RanGAP) involved in mRNA processing and transport